MVKTEADIRTRRWWFGELGDLERRRDYIRQNKGAYERAFAGFQRFPGGYVFNPRSQELRKLARARVRRAYEALTRLIKSGPTAPLKPGGENALIALVHVLRHPVLLSRYNELSNPLGTWKVIEENRSQLENLTRSVGCIKIYELNWYRQLGTGFVIARNRVLTADHVLKKLFIYDHDGNETGRLDPKARIEFARRRPDSKPAAFRIVAPYRRYRSNDIAFASLAPMPNSGDSLPPPIPVRLPQLSTDHLSPVCVLGYPAVAKLRGNKMLYSLFGGKGGLLRLSAGHGRRSRKRPKSEIGHHCLAPEGMSGGPFVELENGLRVCGVQTEFLSAPWYKAGGLTANSLKALR